MNNVITTLSDEEMTKIKLVDLDKFCNFYVHDFFIWNQLVVQNNVWRSLCAPLDIVPLLPLSFFLFFGLSLFFWEISKSRASFLTWTPLLASYPSILCAKHGHMQGCLVLISQPLSTVDHDGATRLGHQSPIKCLIARFQSLQSPNPTRFNEWR